MSLSRRSHLMSGCRRITPVPEQGASTRMRSKGWPSHQCAGAVASPATRARRETEPLQVLAHARRGAPHRCPAPAGRACRRRARAGAWPCRPARRRHRARACRARAPAGQPRSCEAASCTVTSPSAKPGISATGSGARQPHRVRAIARQSLGEPGPRRAAPGRQRPRGCALFTRSHSGGGRRAASSTSCQRVGPVALQPLDAARPDGSSGPRRGRWPGPAARRARAASGAAWHSPGPRPAPGPSQRAASTVADTAA